MDAFVTVYKDVAAGSVRAAPHLATIPCPPAGRPLVDVLRIIAITTTYDPSKKQEYYLISRRSNGNINPDPVTPGTYVLARYEERSPIIVKTSSTLHLIPTAADTPMASQPGTPPSELVSDAANLSKQVDATKVQDLLRSVAFGKEEIADGIRQSGGIDSVRNGILLEISLSKSFDRVEWGIVKDSLGQYRAFAINGDAIRWRVNGEPLHEHLIRLPEGNTPTGGLWSDYFPPDIFFQFHFVASILKFCARGGDRDLGWMEDDDDDVRPILASEEKFGEFVEGLAIRIR
ncbi:hypothetical protein HK097_000865 [Rhizophlyctis rosea]|uniref:Uncharacterized protein n=1 Tax=Rhizophlyctis rosea TaxID=64517 RepID=A0AAD5SNF9_9FUNG|nr:hypothetical protein HK097_000865 [Rhizophlyctis rosea]